MKHANGVVFVVASTLCGCAGDERPRDDQARDDQAGCGEDVDVEITTQEELDAVTHCRALGWVMIENVTAVDLQNLERVGFLELHDVVELTLPRLEVAGLVFAESLDALDVPSLRVGSIYVGPPSAASEGVVSLPSLETATGLTIQEGWAELDAPVLREVEQRLTLNVKRAHLPRLEAVGDITIDPWSPLERIDLPALQTIEGELSVDHASQLNALSLPSLTRLGELAVVSAAAIQRIDAPNVVALGTTTIHECPLLERLELPSLERLEGDVTIESNAAMTTIDLSAVTVASGSIALFGNPPLVSVDLSSMTHIQGSLQVFGNAALASLELPALRSASSIWIGSNAACETVTLPALESALGIRVDSTSTSELALPALQEAGKIEVYLAPGASISAGSLTSAGDVIVGGAYDQVSFPALSDVGTFDMSGGIDARLTSLELGQLETAYDLRILDQGGIAVLSLPSLRSIEREWFLMNNSVLEAIEVPSLEAPPPLDVRIAGNPVLATCHVLAILNAIGADTAQVLGNDDEATCP